MTEEQREQLPLYAQDFIRKLESEVQSLREAYAERMSSAPTRINAVAFADLIADARRHENVYLPDRSVIEFGFDGPLDGAIQRSIQVALRDGVLRVMGGSPLQVTPQSATTIHVRPE